MKKISLILCMVFAAITFFTSCNNENSIENPNQKGKKAYQISSPCRTLYYDEQFGEDFESALSELIKRDSQLSALGDNLYIEQTELDIKGKEGFKVIQLQFFMIDKEDNEFPLKVLSAAHDAIDTDGMHYIVEFCND